MKDKSFFFTMKKLFNIVNFEKLDFYKDISRSLHAARRFHCEFFDIRIVKKSDYENEV